MSAFKTHKRKSGIKTEPESPNPKSPKLEKVFLTPDKTPKQNKTPKNVNQRTVTPGSKPFNKNTPHQAATPKPKLEMFKGTGKLDFKTPPNNIASANKIVKGETSDETGKANRHKMRRALSKTKRHNHRQNFRELKNKAIQGDQAAINEIKVKIASLESEGTLSNTKRRKLAVLKRVFSADGSQKNLATLQPIKKPEVQSQKKGITQNAQKKLNGKPSVAQTKPSVKLVADEEESDEQESGDDEEGSADEEDENESGSAEEESGEEDEDSEDAEVSKDAEDSEEESDVDDEASKGEEESDDEEDSDEKPTIISSKKPPQQQKNQQPQQKFKPGGKQETPSKPPIGGSPNKSSRYVVFVGNIAYTSTDNDLRDHFKKAGDIADVRIPSNQEGKPRGFAYVELKNEAAYQKALSLHNSFLGGRKINVLYSQSGNKKSNKQKGEMKAKNFKLQAMRKQGKLQGGVNENQKRSARRAKNKQRGS